MKGLPEDKRAELFKLVLEGKLSFGQIAAKFGISRSAAIGLAHRAKIKTPRDKSQNARKYPKGDPRSRSRSESKPKPQNKATVVQLRAAKFLAVEAPIKWEDFNSPHAVCWECFETLNHCHWPVRDEPFQFCGHPKPPDKGIPYCEYHTDRARRK